MRKFAPVVGVACVLTAAMGQPPAPTPTPPVPAAPAKPATSGEPKSAQPSKDATGKSVADPPKEPTPPLKVGSDAPAFKPEAWVKGREVKSLDAGGVYVVEFWATWRPYRDGVIPHLNKLQKDNPGLTVIWVTAFEPVEEKNRKGKPEAKPLQWIKDFMRKQGRSIDYRVAFDSRGNLWKDWMQASGGVGKPWAFIVGHDSKVSFIGDPSGLDAEVGKALKAAAEAAKPAKK